MKPILAYKPQDYAYRDILLQFQDGKPLSCDALNFLYRYEHYFAHPALDAVCRYYLKQYHAQYRHQQAPPEKQVMHPVLQFAVPAKTWHKQDVDQFKAALTDVFKRQMAPSVEMVLSPDAFNHLRSLTLERMIYLHGYRLTLHEGFFPGWYPYSVYFQWVDIFGVAKYELKTEQGMTKTIVSLYLEPRYDRPLEECVQDYLLKNRLAFKPAEALMPKQEQIEANENKERNQFTPQLTLSRNKEIKDDEK